MRHPVHRKGPGKKGFTLAELLTVVGITAVLLALVIPAFSMLQRNLKFTQLNNDAKEIFLAAQNNLSRLHSSGAIGTLKAKGSGDGAYPIPADQSAGFPAGGVRQYCYTTSEACDQVAFGLVLPYGSVDETLREKHILIEYNPTTGNVYSVFYSEQNVLGYTNGSLSRDEEKRRGLRLGYYCGSLSSGEEATGSDASPSISVSNGQELSFTVCVPVPEAYRTDWDTFQKAISISATVNGSTLSSLGGGFTVTSGSPDFQKKLSGQNLVCTFTLDSLRDSCGFAELAGNNKNGSTSRAMSGIEDESNFQILPGDNLTIRAEVSAVQPEGKPALPLYSTELEAGTNSLFEKLEPDAATGKYIIHVANGRQLQNLNALSPGIAGKVETVRFDRDIYWNDTVQYYGTGGKNSAVSAPGRCLPYFVPVSNPALFGGAVFSADTLRDTAAAGATVDGNGKKVWYLNIDTGKASPAASGSKIYTGASSLYGDDCFTGLFGFVNTSVKNLSIVNPTVRGKDTRSTGRPAAGALAGVCGRDAFLEGCSAYLDIKDRYYGGSGDFYSVDSGNKVRSDFGVTGYGAVGGLVGYAVSGRRASGEPDGAGNDTFFSHCFAALNVKGTVNSTGTGLVNGVGGFAGCLDLANCRSCYASGNVTADGSKMDSSSYQAIGAGGFTGTSLGTKYGECFASGNTDGAGSGGFVGAMYGWDSGGKQTASFRNCYSAGTASTGEGFCGFCGSGNGYTAADLPQPKGSGASSSSYANYYDNRDAAKPSIFWDSYCLGGGTYSAYCAETIGYHTLKSLAALRSLHSGSAFPASSWEASAARNSHSYTKPDSGWAYPLPKLAGLDYYGDWKYTLPSPGGFVYYEKYSDGSYGFYQDSAISTLKGNSSGLTVLEDGYAILSDTSLTGKTAVLNGSSFTLKNPQTSSKNGRQCFLYPLTLPQNTNTAFYTKEELSYADSSGQKDDTFYCDPDFAHTQVQSVGNSASDVPDSIAVRSARQLANINAGSKNGQRYFSEEYHYVQEMDLNLSGSNPLTIGLLSNNNWWYDTASFHGTYEGSGENGAAVAVEGLRQPFFYLLDSGSSLGNLRLIAAPNQTGLGVGGQSFGYAVTENSGTISQISVTVPEGSNSTVSVKHAGLVAGNSSGSIAGCSAVLESKAKFSASAGGGSAGGIVGNAAGNISNCSVTLKNGSDFTTAANCTGGIVGSSSGSISGCTVTLDSSSFTASQGGGNNGGLVGSSAGSISDCTVLLSSSALTMEGNTAGGFAGTANWISGCKVALESSRISAANGGAVLGGFTGKLTGSAAGCSVSGVGTITSGGNAAGFAGTVSGNLSGCTVTPVLLDSNLTGDSLAKGYGNSGYGKLTVSGRTASGFACSVGRGEFVDFCRTVCTVSGSNGVSGFVSENSGTVKASFANTVLSEPNQWAQDDDSGGFANRNNGTISGCYCWYGAPKFTNGFVSENSGNISGCYAAPLNTSAKYPFAARGSFADCFGVGNGISPKGVSSIILSKLKSESSFESLHGSSSVWVQGGKFSAYPFTASLDSGSPGHTNYPYPMLKGSSTADGSLDHLGDWALPAN